MFLVSGALIIIIIINFFNRTMGFLDFYLNSDLFDFKLSHSLAA